MNDLISRREALKAVSWDTEAYMAINMLPSAEPDLPIKEKCAYCPHCENCDVNDDLSIAQPVIRTQMSLANCISRQAAIDAIQKLNIPEDMCVFEIMSHIELEIGTLPSVHPELIEKAAYIRGFEQGRAQGMIDSQGGKK